MVGGREQTLAPLPLSDGRFLHLQVSLARISTEAGPRWKVRQARYQYQLDREATSKRWLFRYDYLREPDAAAGPPSAHLNLHALPAVPGFELKDGTLRRVHFPTRRMSIEAVIRLLIDEFAVPCASDGRARRAMLAESERAFLEIAHGP